VRTTAPAHDAAHTSVRFDARVDAKRMIEVRWRIVVAQGSRACLAQKRERSVHTSAERGVRVG
jgi:hypothetical protein